MHASPIVAKHRKLLLVDMRPVFTSLTLGLLAVISACKDAADPEVPTGALQVSVSGLPDTIDAAITVTGPAGFRSTLTRGLMLASLTPGTYTVSSSQVRTAVATFVPAIESLTVSVGASAVSQAAVIYSVTTGAISLAVTGTPPDTPPKILITGPAGYRDSVSASRTLGNLAPGIYFVSASEVRRGLSVYAPGAPEFSVTLTPSATPKPAAVGYSLITGTLSLTLNGLPSGRAGSVAITGPLGFSATETSSVTLEGLRQGRYEISASSVGTGSAERAPSPAKQNLVVVAGSTAVVSVNYWPVTPAPGLNLAIEALQLQQVVQTYGGAVPMIAGRDALLRVFVRATAPNATSPVVRVRFFDGLQPLATYSVPAPVTAVPTVIDEGALAASWNLPVPGAMVRPGLRILADVDPDNLVAELDEGDNTWPSVATPLALDVRVSPPLNVRFVPITQSSTGLTGNITTANIARYEAAARQLLPVNGLATDIRPAFTTSAPALQPNDANGSWVQLLSELNALRAAEGSSAHYYGVVRVPYTAGIVGISYLPSFVALGFDSLPNAATTFVHEMGHHFGRLHSRSCGAGGVDANYPYDNGVIGVFGYDAAIGALWPPSTPDIMGYCDNRWISDYTYSGILGFRATQTGTVAAASHRQPAAPGLLLWGRLGPKGIVLEPAFEVSARPTMPASGGPNRIELLGATGEVLLGLSFSGQRVVDGPATGDEHFAFVVPLDALSGRAVAEIRLRSGGRVVTRSALTSVTADQLADRFAAVAQRLTTSRVRLRWTAAPGRGVLVRDAATGAILTFTRGGLVEFSATSPGVDLTFSDGVRSVRRTVPIR